MPLQIRFLVQLSEHAPMGLKLEHITEWWVQQRVRDAMEEAKTTLRKLLDEDLLCVFTEEHTGDAYYQVNPQRQQEIKMKLANAAEHESCPSSWAE